MKERQANKYDVTIQLQLEAENSTAAFDIGYAAAEHLLNTFNDDGSIHPMVRVESKPAKEEPK